jgi:cruciform cutting endonuclease 1
MAPAQNIKSLLVKSRATTVPVLQKLLQQIGCASSGRKDILHARVLKAAAPHAIGQMQGTRILSIDMGIKNLAYCVAKIKQSSPKTQAVGMDILAWRRLDLTEETWKESERPEEEVVEEEIVEEKIEESEEGDPFSPKNLSSTAYRLVGELLKHKPDVILIERQRWRTSSSSAIQQWTVRVNSLEAMLWAMFTAYLRQSSSSNSSMHSMDPKRVGTYWLDGMLIDDTPKTPKKRTKKSTVDIDVEEEEEEEITVKKMSRGKAEKKAKIQLLRAWLDSDNPSTTLYAPANGEETIIPRPEISFRFVSSGAQKADNPVVARESLLWATNPPATRAKRQNVQKADKKMDDITDCFLQAAAYVAWEESLVEFRKQTAQFVRDLGKELGRGDQTLEEVVEEYGLVMAEKEMAEPKKKSTKPRKSRKKAEVEVE